MVVADDRARRESQGLQQKVLGCSGKLLDIEKDDSGDVVCVGDDAANAFQLKARAGKGTFALYPVPCTAVSSVLACLF